MQFDVRPSTGSGHVYYSLDGSNGPWIESIYDVAVFNETIDLGEPSAGAILGISLESRKISYWDNVILRGLKEVTLDQNPTSRIRIVLYIYFLFTMYIYILY